MKLKIGKTDKDPLALAILQTARRLEKVIALLHENKKAANSLVEAKHPLYHRRLRELQEGEDRLAMRIPKLLATLRPLSEATRVAFDGLRTTVPLYVERHAKAKIMTAIELQEQASSICHNWELHRSPRSVDMLTSFEREWDRVLRLPRQRKYVLFNNEEQVFTPPFLTLEEAEQLQKARISASGPHNSQDWPSIRDVSGLKLTNGRLTGRQVDLAPRADSVVLKWEKVK